MAPGPARVYISAMTKKFILPAGLVAGGALIPLLFGCVAESGRSRVRVQTPSVYVESGVSVEDDYVYYPGYEVYYSNTRHQYMYRDGSRWVTRAAPPRVQLNVLLASPSVRADFRDSPERHHEEMVRRYPKNWKPSENKNEIRKDDRKDGRKDDHDDDRKHN